MILCRKLLFLIAIIGITKKNTVVLCPETHREAPTIPVSMLIEAREAYNIAFPEHKT